MYNAFPQSSVLVVAEVWKNFDALKDLALCYCQRKSWEDEFNATCAPVNFKLKQKLYFFFLINKTKFDELQATCRVSIALSISQDPSGSLTNKLLILALLLIAH